MRASQGAGLAFLAEESSSPTRRRLVGALRAKFPRAVWAEYEPVADEPPVAAAQAAFGVGGEAALQFREGEAHRFARCGFPAAEAGSLYYARAFSNGRRVTKKDDPMNRLYVAESGLTSHRQHGGSPPAHRDQSHARVRGEARVGRLSAGGGDARTLHAGTERPAEMDRRMRG